jgi:hypothetical protein
MNNALKTKRRYIVFLISFSLFTVVKGTAQDSLSFDGQLSAWIHYNPSNTLNTYLGARYIPQLDFSHSMKKDNRLVDFELSANIYGNLGSQSFDTIHLTGDIKPYRIWGRYSSQQWELRFGLQKINFGSAQIFRPLMWFDQIDPRDPLQLTDGVWGLLSRYYFLNNTNIWIWCLYGNKDPKGWEILGSSNKFPELGGRIQTPLGSGDAALSYHYRKAQLTDTLIANFDFSEVPEQRLGIDGRWDYGIGLWFEAAFEHKQKNLGELSNLVSIDLGLDYTFGFGNGLYAVFEQLIVSSDEKALAFENPITYSLLSVSYPIGLFDNLSAIIYFSWTDNSIYNFIYWQRQFNRFDFYIMAYWNPEHYTIPTQSGTENLYGGKGLQCMFVFTH